MKTDSDNTHSCDVCGKGGFPSDAAVQRHFNAVHKVNPL